MSYIKAKPFHEIVIQTLETNNIFYAPIDDENKIYTFRYSTQDKKEYPFFLYIDNENKIVYLKGVYPIILSNSNKEKVLDYINYVNYRTSIGNIETNTNFDEAYYRVGINFKKQVFQSKLILLMLNMCIYGIQSFEKGLNEIATQNTILTIEQAYKLNQNG